MLFIIHCCVVYKGFVRFIVFLTMVTLDKEHDRDKRLSRTQISVVSEHAIIRFEKRLT